MVRTWNKARRLLKHSAIHSAFREENGSTVDFRNKKEMSD